MKFLNILRVLPLLFLFSHSSYVLGEQAKKEKIDPANVTAIERRADHEDKVQPNYFAITFYKPTYILPFYFTGSPYNAIYRGNTPDGEQLKSLEVKYQLSFKVPVWKDILGYPSTLHFAYTQMSYWQLYNKHAFFRETDYEPELFFANQIKFRILKDWNIDFLNIGLTHQSNGFGSSLERTWNRAYVEVISSTPHWVFSVKPWVVFHDNSYDHYNPDLAKYLGYGRVLVGFKYGNQVITLSARNFLERHGRYAAGELAWSFPMTCYIKGYLQVFSGYGQSLIEYNHRTNSVGLGVALSDWV